MVFVGEPNLCVRFSNEYVIRVTNKRGFQFDENGKYETDNPILIKYIGQHYKTEEKPQETIEAKPQEVVKEVKQRHKHEAKPQRKGRKQ